MENVVLTIHLIIAVGLIAVVLLQRSEGGGLGMGGGGGGPTTSSRAAATALSKLTWLMAAGFLVTSMTLTILAASQSGSSSVIDGADLQGTPGSVALPPALAGDDLTAPSINDGPALPPAPE